MDNLVDHIYYNITIKASDNNGSIAKYDNTSQQPILSNPSDFYLAISRFYVPLSKVPVQTMDITPGQTQTNPNLTVYGITLEYNGNISEQKLIYQPEDLTIPVPNPPSNNPPSYEAINSKYYFVYDYQTLINMTNTAFNAAFTAIAAPLGSEAPYISFDPSSQYFSVICQRAYYDETLLNPIKIYFNDELSALYQGLYLKHVGLTQGRTFNVIVKDMHTNYYQPPDKPVVSPPNYYKIEQYYSSINNWNNLKGIMFQTTMPIQSEIAGIVTNTRNTVQLPILTDFNVLFQSGETALHSALQYNASQYRFINLNSSAALYNVNLTAWWVTKNSILYPLELDQNEVLTMKLVFIRKKSAHLYKQS